MGDALARWLGAQELDRRRRMGQFFTPPSVCAVAAAAAMGQDGAGLLDPTCGPGGMLAAGRDRLPAGAAGAVVGVELDAQLADLARGRVPGATVLATDVFHAFALGCAELAWGAAPTVLGNPPYVRYQQVADQLAGAHPEWMLGFRRVARRMSDARLASAVIRACLVAPALPQDAPRLDVDPAGFASAARALLRDPMNAAVRPGLPEARLWAGLVASFSGLSDLSVPTWLLSMAALRPGGRIALVVADSPTSRQYGRLLRYAQLRLMTPELVIEPGNPNWFPDAQVPVSLQVWRRRAPSSSLRALSARPGEPRVLRVRLPSAVDLASPGGLRDAAGVPADAPLTFAADALLARVRSRELPGKYETQGVGDMARRLLATPDGARRGGRPGVHDLEASPGLGPRLVLSDTAPLPPEAVGRAWPGCRWTSLAALGVRAHQGLRTGFNPFFYGLRVGPQQVQLDVALGGDVVVLPDHVWRPVLRAQRELTSARIVPADLPSVVFDAGRLGCPEDVRALKRYPAAWRDAWAVAGAGVLPVGAVQWVRRGASHRVLRAGRPVPVPTLSAVAPNVRCPSLPSTRPLFVDAAPPPPAWWYTLHLKPRHVGQVVLGRLVHMRPRPALNVDGAVIDANFSTLIPGDEAPPAAAILALLSATVVAALLECVGTPMGGGALKVEAAHLRRLPLPILSQSTWQQLAALGAALARGEDVAGQIDAAICPEPSVRVALTGLADELRSRRQGRAGR